MAQVNCSRCGRFVGPDGNYDIIYDPYMADYEMGYPKCGKCLREEREEESSDE